jgi:hypothetical protein
MSKGSVQRPTDQDKFSEGYDVAFKSLFNVYYFRGDCVGTFETIDEATAFINKQTNPTEYYYEKAI